MGPMINKDKEPDLLDVAVDLEFQAKTLNRQAAKIEQQEGKERKKVLDALAKGQTENAKIFAENVIRQRREAQSTRRFGAKMSALSSKVKSAAQAQMMSQQLKDTVPALKKAMVQMEKSGISNSVAEFEKVFEDMEVKTTEIDQAMDNVYSSSIDQGEVNTLM